MSRQEEKDQSVKKHPNVVARETPNSYEAESALLGGILMDGPTATRLVPQLGADDFYTPGHRHIFAALVELFGSAKPIDFVTVVGELEKAGTLALSGGVEYLSQLTASMLSVANIDYYFDTVKKMSRLRAIINIAKRMADEAYALEPDENVRSRAEAELYAIAEKTQRGKPRKIGEFVEAVLNDITRRKDNDNIYKGVPTGFTSLDNMLGGGFQSSDLIILAARPGQGKTSFAMNCAVNAALRKRPDTGKPFAVAVFSLEMSAVQLAKRILCSVAHVDMARATRAITVDAEWDRLYLASDRLGRTKLFVDETGNITPAEIISKCRALRHEHGLDFVVIDYLQLMQSGKRVDNFVREIAEITRALKLAAKELNVPILLLSQMSRTIEQRKGPDKESRLSDLRDSGAIEQDADIVLFIDKKSTLGDDVHADTYLNVAKHRNGQTGNIRLLWNPSTTTFSEPNDKGEPEAPIYRDSRDDAGAYHAEPPQRGTKNYAPKKSNNRVDGDADSADFPADARQSAVDTGLLDD